MLKKTFFSFLILFTLFCFNNVVLTAGNIPRHDEFIAKGNRLIVKKKYNEALYKKGNMLDHVGRYEEAIETYNRIIELKPYSHEAWNNKGLTLARIPDRRTEAVEAYDRAIEIKPDFYEAWINKGNAYVRIRNYEDAVKSCDKAIEIKPGEHAAWADKGFTLADLGENEKARGV